MPSNHVKRVLQDSEAVSKRMQASKREIEQLRAEYERLLERGLQAGTSNITDTDKQKEILSKREEQDMQVPVSASSGNVNVNDTKRFSVKRKPPEKPHVLDSARTALEQGSPPKVRHYNPEDAREYIRKQRERRLQQQKQLKETDNVLELKKLKLKDLHQRSLQIVARNRQRSKSRDNHKVPEELPAPTPTPTPTPDPVELEQKVGQKNEPKPLSKVVTKPLKPNASIHLTANITCRNVNTENLKTEEVKYVKSSAKSDDAKIKAATLIQAYFRGHIQRKQYKDALKQRIKDKQTRKAVLCASSTSKKAVKQQENKRVLKNIFTLPTEELQLLQPVEHIQESKKKFSEWLQIEPSYHPYNFINSVKRKLNVALSTPVKTSDVGIQSSLSERCPCPPNEENTPQRYKEMKEKIELSLSSKKSDKEINAKIERSLEAIRNIQREHLTNGSHTNKNTAVINGSGKGFLDLDVKRLEKLRLQSDHSDSDTSKNIPDISLESKYKSSLKSATSASSESATSVFKHPKEAPPKPKRLSRHELHLSAKSNESQKFAEHAKEHLDDYKLDIDVDKLKNIKLQRRLKNVPCLDNTMLHYEESSKKSSNDQKTRNSGGSGSSSSINTISRSQSLKSQEHSNSNFEENSSTSTQSINNKTNEDSKVSSDPHSHADSQPIKTESSLHTNTRKSSKPQQSDILYSNHSGSRRDSTITGNITRYTKSFDSYNTNSKESTTTKTSNKDTQLDKIQEKAPDETADIPDNLLSFRQYMKEMDESQKIMHTPFQPRGQGVTRNLNPEKRLQEVIYKVNLLDRSERRDRSSNASRHSKSVEVVKTNETKDKYLCDKPIVVTSEPEVPLKDKLVPPNVNLIVVKCTDDNKENKLTARTSTDTMANGPTNQIHVKFEAELHLLNDFNESLKQIMNIEKSMLDLQTKYNLQPTIRETKDTQTSVITSKSITKSNSTEYNRTNVSNASIIEKSINFSRGSGIEDDNKDYKVIVLHRNKNLIMDSSRSNSTLNISDITLNNSMNSTQNAITLNTSAMNASDMDATTPRDKASVLNKLSSVGISVGMFDQLISDEDARIENLKAVLKIREKTLLDRTKGELTWLEIQKKHLLETGKLHEASLLKKKQRGIILRLQEEKNEMQRMREAQKAASKERKTKLKEQQCALIKAQLSKPHVVTRIRRASERRASGPVKVYQSEYYQSETSLSRKSSASASESVVYASRSASIISHVADDGAAAAIASRTEMAKRSLQMREAALQRRRKEAEDLLRWHQKLLREERKIADLEMAASNVINQVPAADGDNYAFKGAAIWHDIGAKKKTELATKSKGIESVADVSSKYSTDFDSDKEDAAKGSVQQSGSLNEIMQNINNITDEISELYKLSSMQKSARKLDGNNSSTIDSDNLLTDSSLSKSRSSKASIISKPKSVPEVSVRVDEENEKVSTVVLTEVPSIITSKRDEISTKTSKSNESKKSFVRIQSNELSLHDVELPEREETEDDFSSIKSEVQNEPQTESHYDDASEGCETLKEQKMSSIKSTSDNEQDRSNESEIKDLSVKSPSVNNVHEQVSIIEAEQVEEFSISDKLSLEPNLMIEDETIELLQESYQSETCDKSPSPSISEENVVIQSPKEIEIMPSSKDISEITDKQNESALEIVNDSVLSEDIVEQVSILPSSMLDTSIDNNIKAEQSKSSEIVSTHDETDEPAISVHELSQVDSPSRISAIDEKEQSVSEQIQDVGAKDESISLQSEENIIVSHDDVSSVVKDVSVVELVEDVEDVEDVEVSYSNESKSLRSSDHDDPEEVLPIIGVKIEEKRKEHEHSDIEELSLDLEVSSNKDTEEDVESVKESPRSITDECEAEVDRENVDADKEVEEVEEASSEKSVDVKKRVSEILADANLNTSIEEKSPRLSDIYVTTYDVISPENSPELGSPVDNSKTKAKDIYGIGNEAQELLRKQLAIEQEIKQIERQQKEQLPYIFVREIPNKPPPPYTPPVQQPTSIVPATPAQIDELAPHLAEIFHRGFAEKTLEYVTFLDTQLDQLENVDKICAEFLFDIAKDYAIHHYKQFVEPDEKAPSWMRLNKPKSFKRPHTRNSLEVMLKKQLKQLFAFEKSDCKESMIIKWSRKKRDPVDELLVVESQTEEAEWTKYDQDELIVREEVTTSLLDMLIEETAICLQEIFAKRQAAESHC